MSNHSSNQVVRFEWPLAGPHVCFSPQVMNCRTRADLIFLMPTNEPVVQPNGNLTVAFIVLSNYLIIISDINILKYII